MTDAKLKIFLVEDEDLVSMLTEDMLADMGYEVAATAANLENGMRIADQAEFELGVLDINLHGKQSYPIAEILGARKIPFVFVSGYSPKSIDSRFAKVPALQKPFTSKALREVLDRALHKPVL